MRERWNGKVAATSMRKQSLVEATPGNLLMRRLKEGPVPWGNGSFAEHHNNTWFPVEVKMVDNGWISGTAFTLSVWDFTVNSSLVKFRKYFPRSFLLELYGGNKCDVHKKGAQNKERYLKAVVDCKPVHVDIAEDPDHAVLLSGVSQEKKKRAVIYKDFKAADRTLEPYFEWYNRDNLQKKIPATMAGLKFWVTRYLLSFPVYVGLNENCQKFESGLYMAVASDMECKKENEKRRQGYSVTLQSVAWYVSDIGSFRMSSQSSGTAGTVTGDKVCTCDNARTVFGLDDKKEETRVCVTDMCDDCEKCPAQCTLEESLTPAEEIMDESVPLK